MSGGGPTSVAIVGGGLAGLAAAVALAGRGLAIELFESRRQLGGRAASYRDPASGETLDHCQHVSLGCCTNLADFCRRTEIAHLFRRDRVLHFFDERGRRHDLQASRWLPAPLHLAPALFRLSYLSWRERLGIARAMLRLAKVRGEEHEHSPTIGTWLAQQRQSRRAIEQFWTPVLVSALGEDVERSSRAAARKVFVDGFLAHSSAYEVEVPTVPLGELYGQRLLDWLRRRGVTVHLGTAVERLDGDGQKFSELVLSNGERRACHHAILAVPWRRAWATLAPALQAAVPTLKASATFGAAPISGVHLWFDRPITPLPHAVLLGTLAQWLFNRSDASRPRDTQSAEHYYQVVISASRSVAGRDRDEIVTQIVGELGAAFPAARQARLLKSRIVTEQAAVFSYTPGLDRLRPSQATAVPNLLLAGDWTATGWPATMEGAVRSGYLAAEKLLASIGRPEEVVAADLPRGWLSRRVCG